MFRTKWIPGLVLWAMVAGPQGAAGQDAGPTSIRVLLYNDAGVPAETLDRAQQEVTALFARSNISFAWISLGTCERSCLRIRIVSKPLKGDATRDPKVVGLAPGTRELRGALAFAFYERIREYSRELGLDASQMLGLVIAHELGHLLLPYGSHSVAGIMRPSWDRIQVDDAARGTLRFTPAQAALIRERLQAPASPIAHAR
jgi:hypothetical protein